MYCCAINCSNNTKASKPSLDPRTQRPVRMHKFPNSIKERERCLQWITNLRRADLHLQNTQYKRVCSTHFEISCYNCQSDISSSSLKCSAVPTIIQCANPPKSSKSSRKPPAKRTVMETEFNDELEPEPSLKKARVEESKGLDLATALEQLEKLKREKYQLSRKLKRSQRKCVNIELEAKRASDSRTDKTISALLSKLPQVPRNLFKILLSKSTHINNWSRERDALNMCFSVYFRSPAAYKVLRASGFLLPHPKSLQRRFKDVLREPGLCPKLLEMLKLRAASLSESEKQVTISIDGMTVKEGIMYKNHDDKIVGFVSNDVDSTKVANQGVLIMVRGMSLRWKQILGYEVCRHNLDIDNLNVVITRTIDAVSKCGYSVRAVVMDQESTQWKWVRGLGVSDTNPSFSVHNKDIFVIADPPHLIKNLRNNFFNKTVQFTYDGQLRVAKFQYLKALFDIDSSSPIRLVPRWSEDHFKLPRGKKMKVLLACQIFSHTASAAIKTCISKNQLPAEAMDTALFLEIVNNMWDFINSNSISAPLVKRAVNSKDFEKQLNMFNSFISFVESWSFINQKGSSVKLPCHQGWLLTLNALKRLSHTIIVKERVMNFLCLRKCNQDHVENMHSRIRAFNGFNDHPHLPEYVNAIRCLACSFCTTELIDSSISATKNCLDEGDNQISFNSNILSPSVDIENDISQSELVNEKGIDFEVFDFPMDKTYDILSEKDKDVIEYISGSVLRKISKNLKSYGICTECFESCHDSSGTLEQTFTAFKEYKVGSLFRIASNISILAQKLELYFRKATENFIPKSKTRHLITSSFISDVDLSLYCIDSVSCNHMEILLKHFIDMFTTIRIFQYVKLFNQSLNRKKQGSELNKSKKLNC